MSIDKLFWINAQWCRCKNYSKPKSLNSDVCILFLAIKRVKSHLFTIFLCHIKMQFGSRVFGMCLTVCVCMCSAHCIHHHATNRCTLTFPMPCSCSMVVAKPNQCRQFAQFKFIFAYKQWFKSLFNSTASTIKCVSVCVCVLANANMLTATEW